MKNQLPKRVSPIKASTAPTGNSSGNYENPSLIILSFSIFAVIGLTYLYGGEIADRLIKISQTFSGKVLGTLVILSIGFFLFLFKRHDPFWYGLFETLFAIFSCYVVFDFIQEKVSQNHYEIATFGTLGTTFYLVVRGMSNMRDGFDRDFFLKSRLPIPRIKGFVIDISKNAVRLFFIFYICSLFAVYDFSESVGYNLLVIFFGGIGLCLYQAFLFVKHSVSKPKNDERIDPDHR